MVSRKILVLPAIIGIFFCGCNSHVDNCNELLKEKLGIDTQDSLSWKKRDILFRETKLWDAYKIQSFDVYLENSGSMDGYVKGITSFEGELGIVIPQIASFALAENAKVTLNYLNDSIIYYGSSFNVKKFVTGLEPDEFSKRGGNRKDSDISDCFTKVISQMKGKEGNVSILISDCVFSPTSNEDIDKYLGMQRNYVTMALKNLGKEYGVMVYRFMSMYDGTYYNKVKPHHNMSGINKTERPYFIWIFGQRAHLAKIRHLLAKEEEKGDFFVDFSPLDYISYSCKQAHCLASSRKHVKEARLTMKKRLKLDVYVNYDCIPLNDEYVSSKDNYLVEGNVEMKIKQIIPTIEEDGFTHKISLESDSLINGIKSQSCITLTLKRPVLSTKWTNEYDDPDGMDYAPDSLAARAHITKRTPRTFGIRSLIEGTYQTYSGDAYAKMAIIIN